MELQELKQNRFIRNFARDKWLIAAAFGMIAVFAVIFALCIYHPVFKSTAKVWIKDTGTENYVVQDESTDSQLKPLTTMGNPVLTQIEILESNEMKRTLADYIRRVRAEKNGMPLESQPPVDAEGILKVKSEPGTDIISLALKWDDPQIARELLQVALNKYDRINLGINRKIRTQKREYLDQQVAAIERKLRDTRDKIRDFQVASGAVNLEEQTRELVRLKTELTTRYADAMAARSNSASSFADLQGMLGMSPRRALLAVALGSGNENLVKMRTTLNELKQQAAHDAVKNAATNPKMVALKDQIATLERQIAAEVRQTVGKGGDSGLRIYDDVRGNLVQEMASTRAQARGHGSQAAMLSSAIANVDTALKNVPGNKFMLDNLLQEEKALSVAYDELRKRQIEAHIKEAETPSNVYVVDEPNLPRHASFPTAAHILAMSALLGLLVGLGLSMLKTVTEDLCEGAECVEEATGSRVLGVIPWITRPVAKGDGNVVSINDLAYKGIVSNLRLQCDRNQASVITFTTSALQKASVSTAYTLAYRLARLGHTVAMIDADFRSHILTRNAPQSQGRNLTDLILDVDHKLRKGIEVYPEEIIGAMTLDPQGIHLALNGEDVEHAYDYFASRGFRHIVNTLKAHFDWVFIDAPSAAIAPEFLAIADMSDGVVLFVDKRATFSTLRKLARRIRETKARLIGSIIREENPEIERDHRIYLRGNRGGGLPATASSMPVAAGSGKRVEFMGARLDALTMKETLLRIDEAIRNREPLQHMVVNVAKLMRMHGDTELREAVNSSGLINADGLGIVWGARLLGLDIPERVTGIDLMQNLIRLANERRYRVFFLGAEEGVVRDVVARYKRRYPNLQICGYRNGYFGENDELSVAMQIEKARPDILFVGMSSPRKERFIQQYGQLMQVPFMMGVGGSFDVIAGKVKRAPRWMQDAGLEWFYRLMQEPGRMWKRYLVTNAQYAWALTNSLVNTRLKPASYV